jgi:hypothetical protein
MSTKVLSRPTPDTGGRTRNGGHENVAQRGCDVEFHPYADLFPLMTGEAYEAFVANIREHGVRHPIDTYRGQILDGRNRWRACQEIGVPCPSREWDGDPDDILPYVVSSNLQRRHLTESQRAMVAGRLANMRQGERTDLEHSANLRKVSRSDAADALGISERSVNHARKVLTDGLPPPRQPDLRGRPGCPLGCPGVSARQGSGGRGREHVQPTEQLARDQDVRDRLSPGD